MKLIFSERAQWTLLGCNLMLTIMPVDLGLSRLFALSAVVLAPFLIRMGREFDAERNLADQQKTNQKRLQPIRPRPRIAV